MTPKGWISDPSLPEPGLFEGRAGHVAVYPYTMFSVLVAHSMLLSIHQALSLHYQNESGGSMIFRLAGVYICFWSGLVLTREVKLYRVRSPQTPKLPLAECWGEQEAEILVKELCRVFSSEVGRWDQNLETCTLLTFC